MSDCFERSFGTHTLRCFPYFISRITSQEDLERTARVFFETADRLNVDPLEATMIFQSYKMLMPEGSDLAFDVIDSIRRPLDMYQAAALDKKVPGQKMGCQSYIKSRDTNILRPPGASNASATCAACPFSKTRYKNAFEDAEYKLVRYMLHNKGVDYYHRVMSWASPGGRPTKFKSCVDLSEGLRMPYPIVVPMLAECVRRFSKDDSVYSVGLDTSQQFECVEDSVIKVFEEGSWKQAYAPLKELGISPKAMIRAAFKRIEQSVVTSELPSYDEAGKLMRLVDDGTKAVPVGEKPAETPRNPEKKEPTFVSMSLGADDEFNIMDYTGELEPSPNVGVPDIKNVAEPVASSGSVAPEQLQPEMDDEPEIAMPEEPDGASPVEVGPAPVVDEDNPFPEESEGEGNAVGSGAEGGAGDPPDASGLSESGGMNGDDGPSDGQAAAHYRLFSVPDRKDTGLYTPMLLAKNPSVLPYPSDERYRARIVDNIRRRRVLPIEVVPDEAYLPVVIFYDKTDDVFYRVDGGDLGYGLTHILSGQSVTKICYQPYLLCSYSRFFGIKSRNIYPLYSSDPIVRTLAEQKGLESRLNEYDQAWYEYAPVDSLQYVDEAFVSSMRGYVRLWALQEKLCLDKPRALDNNKYLDIALGFSYLRGYNFNDDSVLFRISDSGEFEYNPNVVLSPRRDGTIFTYTMRQFGKLVNSKPFLLGIVKFAREGWMRSRNMQVLSFEPSAGIIQIFTDYYFSYKFENDYIGFLREYACSHGMRGVVFTVDIKRVFASEDRRPRSGSRLPKSLLDAVSMADDRLLSVGDDRVDVAPDVSMGARKPTGATQNETIG